MADPYYHFTLPNLCRIVGGVDEPKLIRLFSDLTGESEGAGRNVVMYLDMLETDYFRRSDSADMRLGDTASEKAELKRADGEVRN